MGRNQLLYELVGKQVQYQHPNVYDIIKVLAAFNGSILTYTSGKNGSTPLGNQIVKN